MIIKLLSLLMIMVIGSMSAQKANKTKRVEAMKIAFITQELSLTTDEAEQFWPIYNTYSEDLKALNSRKADRPDLDNMSEEEATGLIQEKLDLESQKLELRRKSVQQMGSAISQVKIVKLFVAERKFKREVIKRARKNKSKRKMKTND